MCFINKKAYNPLGIISLDIIRFSLFYFEGPLPFWVPPIFPALALTSSSPHLRSQSQSARGSMTRIRVAALANMVEARTLTM